MFKNLHTKSLVQIVIGLICTYRALIIIAGIWAGLFHLNKFTYWNYTISWFFDMTLLLGLFTEGPFLYYLLLILYPILYGSNFLVFSLIIVIIQLDGWILIEETVFGLGNSTIGDLHTGDYLVHVLPLLEIYWIVFSGLHFYVNQALSTHQQNSKNHALYVLYWLFCPLLLIGAFSLFFDGPTEYPTGLPRVICVFLVLGTCAIYMAFSYLIFTCKRHPPINFEKQISKSTQSHSAILFAHPTWNHSSNLTYEPSA